MVEHKVIGRIDVTEHKTQRTYKVTVETEFPGIPSDLVGANTANEINYILTQIAKKYHISSTATFKTETKTTKEW